MLASEGFAVTTTATAGAVAALAGRAIRPFDLLVVDERSLDAASAADAIALARRAAHRPVPAVVRSASPDTAGRSVEAEESTERCPRSAGPGALLEAIRGALS